MYRPLFHKKYTLTSGHLCNLDVDSDFVAVLLMFISIKQTVRSKLQILSVMFTMQMSNSRDFLLIMGH